MCPNDTPSYYQPLLNRLFDNEVGSDVTFLVGHEPETWRFPGHRCVLSDANPVFKAMLNQDKFDNIEQIIPISDVDGKAFDLLLRYLYKEDVVIQSVSTALTTLYAAHKYLCPGLMRLCICYLDSKLDSTNVLQIYEHARVYSGQSSRASAPPTELINAVPDSNTNLDNMLFLSKSLLHNCLLYIDTHAEEILTLESIEDVCQESLKELIERDTLYAPEHLIFTAIERWCSLECKRFHLELSPENYRSVVGDDLLFSVRYLLMNEREFFEGPMRSSLLTRDEINLLYGLIHRSLPSNCSTTMTTITDERIRRMRKKRRPPKETRIQLGKRGDSPSECWKRRDGKKKKKKKNKEKEDSPGRCTGACVTDYVVRALACIFD